MCEFNGRSMEWGDYADNERKRYLRKSEATEARRYNVTIHKTLTTS